MAEKPDAVPINHDQDTTLEDAFGNSTSSVVSDSALKEFLDVNINAGRFICVVTSGGTQIALEQRAVRTLENFSTGLRGALMTEELLQETNLRPYGVVLLVRKGAVLPYARNFSVDTFSEALAFSATAVGVELYNRRAKESCKRLREVINEKRIFVAEYTTVQEYLFSLKHIARRCMPLKERAMFCLAAAVSDFYIPPSELSGHKLEAVDGILTLRLHQVPKCLGLLSSNWAPNAFIVSFKLETDPALLESKARRALEQYDVHLVVGNILNTRYKEVTIVTRQQIEKLHREPQLPIEVSLSRSLVSWHYRHTSGEEFRS